MTDFQKWVTKHNFTNETAENIWSRETNRGVPKCNRSGKRPIITFTENVEAGKFDAKLEGENRFGEWVSLNIHEIDTSTIIKRGVEIEMRLADAWREFT